jgi:hypothetical protein
LVPASSLVDAASAQTVPVAVATFESIGLTWRPAETSATRATTVRYRPAGRTEWREALPLWYDARNKLYRGSIVHLRPATEYEIELSVESRSRPETIRASTWREQFPIAETILLANETRRTVEITRRGTPDGYILYTAKPGGQAVIDGRNSDDTNILIRDAAYVIVRGLTLKNGRKSAITLEGNTHDIVIEWNDISNWGRSTSEGWAMEDGAIISNWGEHDIERIIVQRNRIHHPRFDGTAWTEPRNDIPQTDEGWHAEGALAIGFHDSKGNHVIRYNEVYSSPDRMYGDCIGAGTNQSDIGFPNRDSDIYGNRVEHCWDDAIETEGANINVRVWGNYTNYALTHYAGRISASGPLYLWRNVAGSSRHSPFGSWDDDMRGMFFKAGVVNRDGQVLGGGAEFVFHNTILQPRLGGLRYPIGVGEGIRGSLVNQVTRNNILDAYRPEAHSIRDSESQKTAGMLPSNNFDYDLYSGQVRSASWLEVNGISNRPSYNPTPEFDEASGGGVFTLDKSSPGYDAGVRIPNFNDVFHGNGPDVGAHEAGSPPMQFGVGAYLNVLPPYLVEEAPRSPRERQRR